MPTAVQPAVALLVLWTRPEDADAFDQDYREKHLPLVWQLPGLADARTRTLRSLTHHRLAELSYASPDELMASLAAPAGIALADDTRRLEKTYGVKAEAHVATAEPSSRPG